MLTAHHGPPHFKILQEITHATHPVLGHLTLKVIGPAGREPDELNGGRQRYSVSDFHSAAEIDCRTGASALHLRVGEQLERRFVELEYVVTGLTHVLPPFTVGAKHFSFLRAIFVSNPSGLLQLVERALPQSMVMDGILAILGWSASCCSPLRCHAVAILRERDS